jgi:hypothetical protein
VTWARASERQPAIAFISTTRGKQVAFPTPSAGRFLVTVGFRDPMTADDGNQCRGVVQSLRTIGKHGGLRFP